MKKRESQRILPKQLRTWEKRKRFGRKLESKVIIAVFTCILCINIFFSDLIAGKAEENGEIFNTNIMLLFDISGSMKKLIQNPKSGETVRQELTRGKMAAEWAQEICAILAGSDILFSTGFFSEYCCFLDSEKKIQEGDSSVMETFDHIVFNGEKTNQYNALLAAEERLKEKKGRKYIILLSDGNPDPVSWENGEDPKICYAEIPKGNSENLNLKAYVDGQFEINMENKDTSEEGKQVSQNSSVNSNITSDLEQYTDNFRKKCLELVNSETEDYTVILIGLGNNIELYGDLGKKSDKIKCYNNRTDLEELKALLLEDIGINIGVLDTTENSFTIDKNYGRCIIRIKYDEKKKEPIAEDDYKLYYTSKEEDTREEYSIDNKISLATTTYLYLDNPKLGKYDMQFSKGTIEVQYVEERRIKKVKLSLKDRNGKRCEGEEKNGCIFYDLENDVKNKKYNFDQGKVCILVEAGLDELPMDTKVIYYYKEIENLDQGCNWNLKDETENDITRNFDRIDKEIVWSKDIKVEAGKTYVCKVVITTRDQRNDCISNAICFTVPEIPTPTPTPIIIEGTIGKLFSAQDYIKIQPWTDIMGLELIWGEKILFKNENIRENVEEIQVDKDGTLCFSKEGTYTIEIREGGILKEIVEFQIKNNTNMYENLKDLLKKEKVYIIIAILFLFVILISYLKHHKKTERR